MGYNTHFTGQVTVTPPLNPNEIAYLNAFSASRRMDRTRGPLFVKGMDDDADVRNINQPPAGQPGLYCQWVPTDGGTAIQWDGGENFYEPVEWMVYLIDNLLSPQARDYIDAHKHEDPRLASFTCDHVVNGVIDAEGEASDDIWRLRVRDNEVKEIRARVVYDED